MKRTIAVIAFAIVMAVGFVGCTQEMPYNAMLYDKSEKCLRAEFLTENKTHYPFSDDNLPDNRLFIIKDDKEYEKCFESFSEEIDFSQDILVVYLFTDIYYGFDCKLQNITNNDDGLIIDVLHETAGNAPAISLPTQRCLTVKLSNCNSTNINLKLKYE